MWQITYLINSIIGEIYTLIEYSLIYIDLALIVGCVFYNALHAYKEDKLKKTLQINLTFLNQLMLFHLPFLQNTFGFQDNEWQKIHTLALHWFVVNSAVAGFFIAQCIFYSLVLYLEICLFCI